MMVSSGKNCSGSHDVAEESNEVITLTAGEHGAVDDDGCVVDCEANSNPTNCEMMTPSMVSSSSTRSSSSNNNISASEPKVQASMKAAKDGTSKQSLFLAHSVLYDAVTQRRMVDPVVNLAGDSYERSTVLQSSDATGHISADVFSYYYYPNRALASILKQQREYEQQGQQQQAPLDKGNDETETTAEEIEDRLDIPDLTCFSRQLHAAPRPTDRESRNDENDATKSLPDAPPPLPEAFYCPITCDIMVDPWIGPDGVTYDYDAIYEWLDQNENQPCSPVTREPLVLGQLRPNHAMYELIQYEIHCTTTNDNGKQKHDRHASIQAWMDTTRCTQRPERRPNHPPPPPMGSPIWNKQRSYSWSSSASSWYTSTVPVAARDGSSMEQGRLRSATLTSSTENGANDANHWFNCSCVFTFVMLLTMAFVVIVFSSKLFLLVLLLFCAVVTTIKYMMRNDDE